MSWQGSTRSERLPADWDSIRRAVKRRARGRCEATKHDPRCPGTGAECDHITPGDDHSLSNLQWLSTECHKAKTSADNAAANHERARLRRRPTEQHPGSIR